MTASILPLSFSLSLSLPPYPDAAATLPPPPILLRPIFLPGVLHVSVCEYESVCALHVCEYVCVCACAFVCVCMCV